jgi:hypothetical protein
VVSLKKKPRPQHPGEAAVGGGIVDARPISPLELAIGVNWRGGGFAGVNASTVKQAFGVLLLGKEEATGGARDTNTKEEVQRAHVLHGKFTDEVMNDAHQILGFLDLT